MFLEFVDDNADFLQGPLGRARIGDVDVRAMLANGYYLSRYILVIGTTYHSEHPIRPFFDLYYRCIFAENEWEAIALLKRVRFDLVISDFSLESTDSYKLMEIIGLIYGCESLPFIVVLNSDFPDVGSRHFGSLARRLIVKPDNDELLLECINMLLDDTCNGNYAIVKCVEDVFFSRIVTMMEAVVMFNVGNKEFAAGEVAKVLNYTRRDLSSLLKGATGLSLEQYIVRIRIRGACRLIINGEVYSINEARYAVGIDSISYFNRKFKEYFGMNPNRLRQ